MLDIKTLRTRCEAVAKNKMNVLLVNCQDMFDCLDEIERLRTLVQDAYYEGGDDAHAHMVWDNSNACKALTE